MYALPADYSLARTHTEPQPEPQPEPQSQPQPPATAPQIRSSVATVTQTVTISPVASRSDLTKPEAEWTWQELRDYVTAQIEQRFGAFPRDSKREYGIFNRFLNQWGTEGIFVARAAFEVYNGWWKGSPIRVERFCKGSDEYFCLPILEQLKGSGQ